MKKHISGIIVLVLCLFASCCVPVYADTNKQDVESFLNAISSKLSKAQSSGQNVVAGKDGWLYFVPELRSVASGRFWGSAAAKVNKTADPEYADPLPAILDFKKQLDKAKISLIMVPVPAKCVIYPEYITGVSAGSSRLDPYHQEFYQLLKKQGIKVIDLTPVFMKNRSGKLGPLYCKQDTHWSGQACALTAGLIAAEINKQAWTKSVAKKKYVKANKKVTVKGDLLEALGNSSIKPESLTLTTVKQGAAAVADWRQSPVLLLGDSHNLIFHSGEDMQAHGAGLADHLAASLGFPVDLVAVRGSGATPSRMNLMRRRDNMKGKKVVVWCFSVREFTEGQGWRKVPVVK